MDSETNMQDCDTCMLILEVWILTQSQNKPDIDFFLSALSIQYFFTASNTIFNVISTKKKKSISFDPNFDFNWWFIS